MSIQKPKILFLFLLEKKKEIPAVVDLPTPPLPEATAIACLIPSTFFMLE